MKISIIVIGYNGRRFLDRCLKSVLDQYGISQADYEIFYVDNNSQDGSIEFVAQHFPQVKILQLEKNYGYYWAFNFVSMNIAQGEYLIPLPQDTVVHRKWLSELIKVADSDENVKICLVNSVNPSYPDFDKQERDEWTQWVYLMGTSRLGYTKPMRWLFSHEVVQVLAYSGISALIKRDLLAVTDYFFDSSLSHFLGDVEIGIRTNVLGYKVVLVPNSIVYHIEDNKSWLDFHLLLRTFRGARDSFVVYFKNMFRLEFCFFAPLLYLGIPLKVFGLRIGFIQKIIMFFIALFLSPLAFLLAILSFPKYEKKRKNIISKRRTDEFWLLRTIIKKSRY